MSDEVRFLNDSLMISESGLVNNGWYGKFHVRTPNAVSF